MHRIATRIGLIAAIAWCANGTAATKVDPPTVRFYEAKWGTEANICTISILEPGKQLTVRFKDNDCDNDEADSMKLHNMPPGSIITVYDDPDCGDHRSWHRTTVARTHPGVTDIVIPSFETEWPATVDYSPSIPEYQWATVLTLHYESSLNGKVSCAIIDVPAAKRP